MALPCFPHFYFRNMESQTVQTQTVQNLVNNWSFSKYFVLFLVQALVCSLLSSCLISPMTNLINTEFLVSLKGLITWNLWQNIINILLALEFLIVVILILYFLEELNSQSNQLLPLIFNKWKNQILDRTL